jgi:hypothetical protein
MQRFLVFISVLIAITPASTEYIALRERSAIGLASRSTSDLFELLQPKDTISLHWGEGKSLNPSWVREDILTTADNPQIPMALRA